MSDGTLDVAALVARARSLGVVPSVADHVTHDIALGIRSVGEAERYIEEFEPDIVLPEPIVRRLSHRVGSLHGVFLHNGRLVHMFGRWTPGDMTPRAYMDVHIANLERFAREMPVDVLAHPTLVPIAFRKMPAEELWTDAHEERAVQALRAAGIAFEVSNRYRPHERFVRRAVDAGVRMALGSDGHSPEQVADVAWPLELLRRIGAHDHELYDPRVHGSRTGFHEEPSAPGSWGW